MSVDIVRGIAAEERSVTFIRNAWYMGAWAEDVTDKPLGRMILGDPVVMFRTADGHVAVLRDICPHRAVPLSLGTVGDGRIRCAYHGLEFDGKGICRKNPHIEGPPDRLRTGAYPAAEKHGGIWIWMGDAAADPEDIPEYDWMDTTHAYGVGRGYLNIEADYKLVIDNLMDLAHAEYIHPHTVGIAGAVDVQQVEVIRGEDAISVNAVYPGIPPSMLNRRLASISGNDALAKGERFDQYQDMMWRPVSNLYLVLGTTLPGRPRDEGVDMLTAHILTPETETKTHYFHASARPFVFEEDAVVRQYTAIGEQTFVGEDKPILEAAQRNINATGAKLTSFTIGDTGSTYVRRAIERIAALEKAKQVA